MDISRGEEICKASLRLFKLHGHTGKKHSLLVEVRSQHSNKLITSKEISCDESGWQSFDVTNSMRTWVLEPNNNKGFKVQVKQLDKHDPSCDIKFATNKHEAEKPILVVFSDNGKQERCSENKTSIVSINRTKSKYAKLKSRRQKRLSTGSRCEKSNMSIRFSSVWPSWDHSVLMPKESNIYRCSGNCDVYSSQTKHAKVQAILSEIQPASLPNIDSPCCSPTAFDSMLVLKVESKNSMLYPVTKLSYLDNMIVSSCGCR